MNYNIILTDNKGSEVKVRLKIPYASGYTDATNSRWHAEGGKLKYANGTCQAINTGGYLDMVTAVNMVAGADTGVSLYDFFSGFAMGHNQGGKAVIAPGWGGTQMVPGAASWTIDD